MPSKEMSAGIVGIFVVAFDTRKGNTLEWQYPQDLDLGGVEFKALVSGLHLVKSDFVYFRKDRLFGVACSEKKDQGVGGGERGARMKSVGVLVPHYTSLYKHLTFLQQQIRYLLDNPGQYDTLFLYFQNNKLLLPASTNQNAGSISSANQSLAGFVSANQSSASVCESDISLITNTSLSSFHADISGTLPVTQYRELMLLFGVRLFTLWKLLMCKCRIIFYTKPPIGALCQNVSCIAGMGTHGRHAALMTGGEVMPYFYVSVADIPALQQEFSYIACTTERIYEMKQGLHDVFVSEDLEISVRSDKLKPLLRVTEADKDRHRQLVTAWDNLSLLCGEDDQEQQQDFFTRYFEDLNNSILDTLITVADGGSTNDDRVLSTEQLQELGLNSAEDRAFVAQLLQTYGLDVNLEDDRSYCYRLLARLFC